MVEDQPVGVFDSGVGGISVLAELCRVLPDESFIYYGDTLNAPYGTKPVDEVMALVRRVVDNLLERRIKALVIACNTATSVAAAALRQELEIPVIGMEPALKPASLIRRNGSILVLATPNTLTLPKFLNLMKQYGEGAIPVPCPGLMELIEQENAGEAESYLHKIFSDYDMKHVDAVVLGCTHYVFLKRMIRDMLPSSVSIMDGNHGTAMQLRRVLEERELLSDHMNGRSITLLTSGREDTVLPVMRRLLKDESLGTKS